MSYCTDRDCPMEVMNLILRAVVRVYRDSRCEMLSTGLACRDVQ